jgi:hypothetical protein
VYTTLGLLQAVGIGVTAIVVGILRSSDASLVLWSTFPSHRSMVPSLRSRLNDVTRRCRTATCLPLDVGLLPYQGPATRQKLLAGSSARRKGF